MLLITSDLAKVGLSLAIYASTAQGQNITSDTHFYGQSPPFYPSRMFPQSINTVKHC